MRFLISSVVLASCSLLSVAGCSSSGETPAPAPAPVTQPATTSDLAISINEAPTGVAAAAPLAGAKVALSNGSGVVAETESNASGVATFPKVDWTQGPYGVTAFAPSHSIVSLAGIVQSDTSLSAALNKTESVPFAQVSRKILGLKDAANEFATVTATVANSGFQQANPVAYSFNVALNTPFQFVGLEWRA